MAVIGPPVWIFTSADAGATVYWASRFKIKRIYWFNPTTIGDLVTVTDQRDKTIVKGRAEVANGSQVLLDDDQGRWFDGLKIPTLASGELQITIW